MNKVDTPTKIQTHVHQNILDANLSPEHRQAAEHMIATLALRDLRITWVPTSQSLQFAKDRRVVTISWALYKNECWTDIRHLFRAILDSAPAVDNRGAPNDWGPLNETAAEAMADLKKT
jgi:hypothetical protein